MSDLHVFIDTNIWLSFYAYNKDDLEQLRKVIALINKGKLRLYTNEQLRDEFYRNREQKLKESTQEFAKHSIPKGVPRYMNDYPEAKEYRETLAAYEKLRDSLIDRAKAEALVKELEADKLFADILAASKPAKVDAKVIQKALDRRLRGNPPGKPTSLGDQIHWELLLSEVPIGTDLHIVSKDGDFESSLNSGAANQFLADEWMREKKGALSLHTELRPFLNSKFPDIKLAVDVEKADAIERLVNSGTFASTHAAIDGLALFVDDLSWDEADKILSAGVKNSQISWIGTDDDVVALYTKLMAKYQDKLGAERFAELEEIFYKLAPGASQEEDDHDDVPF